MKKLRVLVVLILLISIAAGYDYYRSTQFTIEVVELTPQPAPADGQTPVLMRLRLLDSRGQPVAGHRLFAFPRGGGLFDANRTETDENGEAVYRYYPYKSTKLKPAKNVMVEVMDESNSVFIEINTKKSVEIVLTEPQEEAKSVHSLSDIFGE